MIRVVVDPKAVHVCSTPGCGTVWIAPPRPRKVGRPRTRCERHRSRR